MARLKFAMIMAIVPVIIVMPDLKVERDRLAFHRRAIGQRGFDHESEFVVAFSIESHIDMKVRTGSDGEAVITRDTIGRIDLHVGCAKGVRVIGKEVAWAFNRNEFHACCVI